VLKKDVRFIPETVRTITLESGEKGKPESSDPVNSVPEKL
jgi:hypothetical protein